MQLPRLYDRVRTGFCRGRIIAIIDGKDKGWQDTLYYNLRLTMPSNCKSPFHLIRLDEIREILD